MWWQRCSSDRRVPSPRTDVFATCSGGILAAMTLAHLADVGQLDRISALTLAVTVLDQTQAGQAAAIVDERAAKAAIAMSAARGYLSGSSPTPGIYVFDS